MLGACLPLSHGAVLGIVQVCTSMHGRGAGGHPCATSGCQEARRRGKRETTERAAPAGPVSQEFAPPAALVVDGDPRVQETLRPALVALGLAVTFEQQPDAALALLMQRRSDVALLALELGSVDGFALMRAVHARLPGLPVLLLVPRGADDCVARAIREGATDCVGKPIVPEEVRARVSAALIAGGAARDRALLEALRTSLLVSGPAAAVLEGVANAAREATGAAASAVFLFEDGRLARVAGDESPATLAAVAAEAMETCAPAVYAAAGRTAQSVPVLIEGTASGALAVEGPGPPADAAPLALLAARAALAVAEERGGAYLRRAVGASLGRLATQIAHELNNPLGGLKLYTSLLERNLAQEEAGRAFELARKVSRAVDDLAARVAEIRGYERGVAAGPLHQLIESCLDECLARGKSSGRGGAGGT